MPVTIPDGFEQVSYAIRRVRRAPYVTDEKKRTFHHRLRVDMETGIGLTSGQGDDPQVMLRYSDDGANTWGPERWTSAGKIGRYKARALWNCLGVSRQRVYEFVITDPVRVTIIGAELDISPGLH